MKNDYLQLIFAFLAVWVNRSQKDVIECLQTENEVYRELLENKRPRFPMIKGDDLQLKQRNLEGKLFLVWIASLHLTRKKIVLPFLLPLNDSAKHSNMLSLCYIKSLITRIIS